MSPEVSVIVPNYNHAPYLAQRIDSASSSTGSGGTSSDCFNKRRPLSDDFATIGSRIGATFEEARRAYYEAIQREHPDKGGSV